MDTPRSQQRRYNPANLVDFWPAHPSHVDCQNDTRPLSPEFYAKLAAAAEAMDRLEARCSCVLRLLEEHGPPSV